MSEIEKIRISFTERPEPILNALRSQSVRSVACEIFRKL